MFIFGIVLICIGVFRLVSGYNDNSAVRMTWYAVEAMGFIVSGVICICVRIATDEISDELHKIGDKLNVENKENIKNPYSKQDKELDYYDLPDSY